MHIQEFIYQIPQIIFQRGQQYADNELILKLEQNDHLWKAIVEGNYGNYSITLQLNSENEVKNYHCNCPYDGALCKHVAAVAIVINEKILAGEGSEKEESQSESWEQLIKKAKLKDLRRFVLDYGESDHDFRHQVKLAFAKSHIAGNKNNIPYYQKQISGVFEDYTYQGFIDYRGGHQAINDVYDFLKKMDRYYAKGNLNEAFCIAAAIAVEGVRVIPYMDDSSGECGGAVHQSFETIENIFHSSEASELKMTIFDWLYEQVQNPDYRNYGLGNEMEPLFFETAKSLKQYDQAYEIIEDKIRKLDATEGWNRNYYLELYLYYKVDLLLSEGRTLEREAIIDQHLHLEKFRQLRVDQSVTEKEFEKAESLILEGIKIAYQEKLPGVVHQWKDQLLNIYKVQKETSKYNALARELFLENSSEINYFEIFKKTTPTERWDKERTDLISALKNEKSGYFRGAPVDDLAGVYIEEQMTSELFDLVASSNSIHTIIRYTDHLKADYHSELIEYYQAAIEIEARRTGRSVYASLVDYLKKMSKIRGGKPVARELKNTLLDQYKKRPAMKEEFKKLGWE